jgi:hypothetical protein
VRPITNLRAEQVVTFFTDIVHRFGVPNSIITDNGSQFTGRKFLEFCDKFDIRVDWAAVAHPQTNDQVERANGMILQGLKPRTTPSRATGFTPFFLVHGAEAILPTDLEYGSPRVRGYDEDANQQAREDSLDQLDEARLVALMHSARYQQSLRRYQARKIRRRCRMDLPGPTTSVGTRTDYSVGPWDYSACATRHLMAWSTRTTEEKYSVRKLYMFRTVWKTPRRTRLVLSPYSDL